MGKSGELGELGYKDLFRVQLPLPQYFPYASFENIFYFLLVWLLLVIYRGNPVDRHESVYQVSFIGDDPHSHRHGVVI